MNYMSIYNIYELSIFFYFIVILIMIGKLKLHELVKKTYYLLIILLIFLIQTDVITYIFLNQYFHEGLHIKIFTIILIFALFFPIHLKQEYYWFLFFILYGIYIMITANNLLTIYIGIEIQSLSFYILIASTGKYIDAAIKYYILGVIASGFYLMGTGIIYKINGTINLNELYLLYQYNSSTSIQYFFSLILLFSGIFFKIGVVPYHIWIPDVYHLANTKMTLILSILPKLSMIYILISFYIIFESPILHDLFIFSILGSFFFGSFLALRENLLKRFLAYSTISHLGFILIGILLIDNMNIIIFYMLIYFINVFIIFKVLIWFEYHLSSVYHSHHFSTLAFFNHPFFKFLFIFSLFSFAGAPPTSGFIAKYYILLTANYNQLWPLIIFTIIISTISFFYYLRLIKIIYFNPLSYIISPIPISTAYFISILTIFLFIFTFDISFIFFF